MYYPTFVQSTPAGTWPNTYQINPQQQQQAIPTVYYQVPTATVPSLPTTTAPEVFVSQQQVPTVYYQTPSVAVPSLPSITVPEAIVSQQQVPTIYYQTPSIAVPPLSSTTAPEVTVSQQPVPTVYYQTPSVTVPPIPTTTTSQTNIQQQPHSTSTTTTKTKTTTTRILNSTTLPTIDKNFVTEEIKTTITATKPETPAIQTITTSTATNVPQVTTVETTTIPERPQNQFRRLKSLSTSTYSSSPTISTHSTITPQPEIIKQPVVILPPQIPIQTTTTTATIPPQIPIQTATIVPPVHRVIHRPHDHRPHTPSGYYSSDLDYGKRKIYKTDYKYRHFYCCNLCKGRCDLHNRSYSCCEWFYGCPLWGLILCGLFFLTLLITFLTLFSLQPSINSTRRTETAETRLLNRTQIIYGFYKNCGYQINATFDTPTTLILCTNTATTSTARIELSSFYTVISRTNSYSYSKILILILLFICFENFRI
ncbi:unnamed protein product [Rotaria sordida]|uniref:Uncharacterized protein n=1 Tax=Rotaria sordida TaxID=392033 RepID=A0A814ZCX6_9BILA|nr:unnamed protein product [Rotaria sordida]